MKYKEKWEESPEDRQHIWRWELQGYFIATYVNKLGKPRDAGVNPNADSDDESDPRKSLNISVPQGAGPTNKGVEKIVDGKHYSTDDALAHIAEVD